MKTLSAFSCNHSQFFLVELENTTSIQVVLVFLSIACPAIIVLNLLVILAVKTRKELKRNSTILLSSLAVVDMLVGTVSIPLAISLDALVLQKYFNKDVFCRIDLVYAISMYTTFCASFLHLVVIAWERYIAIHKWQKYKVIVTKGRIKKYALIAWLAAIITAVPTVVMIANGVHWEVLFATDIIISFTYFLCLLLIGYFYVKVYQGVRNWNRSKIRQVNALIKSRVEIKAAFTGIWLTVFAGVEIVPTFAVFVLGRRLIPVLCTSSFFRWSETVLQFNSLLNPIFYCYRDRRFRKAALELLGIKKPKRIQLVTREAPKCVRRCQQHRDSVASVDFGVINFEQRPCLRRSQSCGEIACMDNTHVRPNAELIDFLTTEQGPRLRSKTCGATMYLHTTGGRPYEEETERPISSSSSSDATQQPMTLTVTAHIETIERIKAMKGNSDSYSPPLDTNEIQRSLHEADNENGLEGVRLKAGFY